MSNRIIDVLYRQSANLMPQYGGRASLEENPYKTIYAYGPSGRVVYGYEFRPDSNGGLSAIRCFGSNVVKDLQGMKMSRKIFELPISRFDESDYPNSVVVYL